MHMFRLLVCLGTLLGLSVAGERTPGHVLIAKAIWHNLLPRIERQTQLGVVSEQDIQSYATLIPPNIPDPDCFGPGFIPIDITIPSPLIKIYGEVGVTSETKAYGFSKIRDEFNLTYRPLLSSLRLGWDFDLPLITLEGDYRMNLTIDVGSTMRVLGEGPLTGTVDTVFLSIRGNASVPPIGKIGFVGLDIDLGFSNFKLDGGDEATAGGVPINWDRFSSNIQTFFDTFWNEETRLIIIEALRCSLDGLINNCTLAQIIGGNADCLNFTINTDCFTVKMENNLSEVVEFGYVDELISFLEPSVVCQSTDPPPTGESDVPTTSSITATSTTEKSGVSQFQLLSFKLVVCALLFLIYFKT